MRFKLLRVIDNTIKQINGESDDNTHDIQDVLCHFDPQAWGEFQRWTNTAKLGDAYLYENYVVLVAPEEPRPDLTGHTKCYDAVDLEALWQRTTFSKDEGNPEWEGLDFSTETGTEDPAQFWHGLHVYVLQCSHFGETLIGLDDTYENSGEDCLFLQELVRLYRAGALHWKE